MNSLTVWPATRSLSFPLVELAEHVATRNNPHLPGGDVYFNEGLIEAGEKPLRPDEPRTLLSI